MISRCAECGGVVHEHEPMRAGLCVPCADALLPPPKPIEVVPDQVRDRYRELAS